MSTVLITGGSGFFGGLLKRDLLDKGYACVNIDLVRDEDSHPSLHSIQGDIRDMQVLRSVFVAHRFDAVFHCAAILAHAVKDKKFLWTSNVDGTKNVAECAREFGVRTVVFTSSNCLWGKGIGHPIREDEEPKPLEIYGKSKWEGEKILLGYKDHFSAVVIRCPTIVDEGRIGLLSILFDFIAEGRKVWVVGGGRNRYQFVYGRDLCDACLKALQYKGSTIFHIGSDRVKSLAEVFSYVAARAATGARVVPLPRALTLFAMHVAHMLGLSPLGPYHYKMIAEDFQFDTAKIKRELNWKPTLTDEEMLWKAYEYYHDHSEEIHARRNASAHRRASPMGIIRLLKWLS